MTEAQVTNTILAALRLWQEHVTETGIPVLVAHKLIATNGGRTALLNRAELDELCETINMGSLNAEGIVL